MNFGFLELDSEYQSPGFQIPQEIISPTPDSTGKNFLESGTGLPGTARKKMRKYPGVVGGVLPYMGYIGICCCEGYGFQAVYSGIGSINQRERGSNRLSFFRKLIKWLRL